MADKKYSVIIVDDHSLFRGGLKMMLESFDNLKVIDEAKDGKDFLRIIEETEPDLVFMDISMPVVNGVDATHTALKLYPDLKVIVLSMHGDYNNFQKMVHAGAKGFLLKNSDRTELKRAITTIIEGGTFFSQELLQNIVNQYSSIYKNNEEKEDKQAFSEREMEVLELICEGLSNTEIAQKLFLSPRTVERHRANMLEKSGAKNSVSLVMYAVKQGFVKV